MATQVESAQVPDFVREHDIDHVTLDIVENGIASKLAR